MWRFEVCPVVSELVQLDDDEASDEAGDAKIIKCEMYISTLPLLVWRVCRLEYESGLGH